MARSIDPMDVTRFGHHEIVLTNGQDKPSIDMSQTQFGFPADLLYGDAYEIEGNQSTWWDKEYQYRRKMDIYPYSGCAVIPSGNLIIATLDTPIMYNDGKCLASRNDVRVVRFNGSIWEELARDYIATTELYFKTRADISSKNEEYYVYFGNPSAGTPSSGVLPVNGWDYQDDFNDASIGADWTTSGTGDITEAATYAQLKHTTTADSANGGWDSCPLLYKAMSDDTILIETKCVGSVSGGHGGLFISDGTRNNAILWGTYLSGSTYSYTICYVMGGKFVAGGLTTITNNYYYRMVLNKGGCAMYYSSTGVTWTLLATYNLGWAVKWLGLFHRNYTTTNNTYTRFDYFYMTNRYIASMTDEDSPQLGKRMRGGKGFKRGTIVPYLAY